MLIIYVDGDACPVKGEVERVAERHGLDVYMVSNGGLRPSRNPKIHMVKVDAGADVADDWIAERAGEGDIVITADILLADRCVKSSASVLGANGRVFSAENIGNAVAGRSISAHLRELGDTQQHNPSFTKADRSRFLQALEDTIQGIKRR